MSIIGSNILAGSSGQGGAYEIEQSLRFDASSYLTRTAGSSNVATVTLSFWAKKCTEANQNQVIISGGNSSNNTCGLTFNNGKFLTLSNRESGNGNFNSQPDAEYRDPSAWYHFVQVIDFTNSTQADRIRVYENGVRVSVFNFITLPTNTTSVVHLFRNSENLRIGDDAQGASDPYPFNGYLAEFHCVDGSALDADQFGEYDDNGVWRPIEYTGSHGTEGFYLKFDPDATNGIGHDHSGNGNNFTATGFTTSGTGTDVMSDTPTANYATINSLETFNGRFSNAPTNGNLEISIPSDSSLKRNYAGMHASIAVPTSGKYYFEFEASQQYTRFVAVDVQYSASVDSGDDYALTDKKSVIFSVSDGNYYYDGANNSTASGHGANSSPSGDIYGVAIDLGNGTLRVDLNGTAGTELDISDWAGGSARVAAFVSSSSSSGTIKYNFGAQGFAQTPPTGFVALNTANLPAPDIADGSDYFNTVLYTGNGSTQSITGVGFQPDWIWCKTRDSSSRNTLTDAVRGADRQLWSDLDTAEQTNSTQFITSFDSDGFTSGPSTSGTGSTNENNGSFVAWNWLAGNGTSSNTNGSITSTVSVNATAGFSIVSYTGTGSSATVGHGLGVELDMVITKARDGGDHNWGVYHRYGSEGAETQLQLNKTTAPNTGTSFWNGTHPTSTVFTINTSSATNNSGSNMIAYCFAEVEGYSKFGNYTGNGSTDGPFVYCGFRPSFLLFKRSSAAEDWVITDSTRLTYNQMNGGLRPNGNYVEFDDDSVAFDFTANGFKVRATDVKTNGSGSTYVFMALAENPFGGSGVSPATAR